MLLYTVGLNYYYNYFFPLTISEELSDLETMEAKEFYKIIFIKGGTCHFRLDDKEFVLTGEYIICLNELEDITFYKVTDHTIKILFFKPTIINAGFTFEGINCPECILSESELQDAFYLLPFKHEMALGKKILTLHLIDYATIDDKLQLIKNLLNKQDSQHWPCRSRSYLFEILFSLGRQEEEKIQNILVQEGQSRRAIDIIYFLQSCYNEKITIEELAEKFHTNRTTLIEEFKKHTGLTVNQYLIQLRLTMASTLLRDTKLPVDEICERTGFSDISYFSKIFKKKLTLTPSEYRRVNQRL